MYGTDGLRAALRALERIEFPSDDEEELSQVHAELTLLDGPEAAVAFGGHIATTAAAHLLYLSKLEQLITEARSAAT